MMWLISGVCSEWLQKVCEADGVYLRVNERKKVGTFRCQMECSIPIECGFVHVDSTFTHQKFNNGQMTTCL